MANANKAATAKANTNENAITEADLRKKANALAATAIKLSLESETALREAFASSMYLAMRFGDCSVLNKIFVEVARKDALAMRAYAVPRMHDIFAKAILEGSGDEYRGIVELNDEGKWIKRPPMLIRFTANPKDKDGNATTEHFTMVRLNAKDDQKPAYEGKQLAFAKALKARIIADGEEGLNFPWVSATQAASTPEIWDGGKVAEKMVKLLVEVAKKATAHRTRQDLQKTATAFGLDETSVSKIMKAYDDAAAEIVKAASNDAENNGDKADESKAA